MRPVYYTFTFLVLFSFNLLMASDADIVPVGEASFEKVELYLDVEKCDCNNIVKIIKQDLGLYRNFFNLDNNKATSLITARLVKVIAKDDNVVESEEPQAKKPNELDQRILLELYNKDATSPFFSKEHELDASRVRWNAHEVSGQIFKAITKKDPIFHSKMVFISDQGDEKKPLKYKQIFISDFDGFNIEKVTNTQGHILSPAVSNDGSKLVYSLIDSSSDSSNVQLRIIDLETKQDNSL